MSLLELKPIIVTMSILVNNRIKRVSRLRRYRPSLGCPPLPVLMVSLL